MRLQFFSKPVRLWKPSVLRRSEETAGSTFFVLTIEAESSMSCFRGDEPALVGPSPTFGTDVAHTFC